MRTIYTSTLLLLFFLLIAGRFDARAQASACPAVTGGNDVTICEGNCANLTASVQGTVGTNTYTVGTIPYNPYSYTTGTGISVGTDDVWSGRINLPFCFQFFGVSYNWVVVGSNGVISFNPYTGYNDWSICGPIPTTCGGTPLNAILGPWHDVDPSYGGAVRYQIYGTSPCRQLAVSWNNVPMYSSSCNGNSSLNATHQIVLHENTNIIDVYIRRKRLCTSWNGGLGIEGIQNATGTIAYTVPGRNATQWTATDDGYRFTPSGAPQYTVQWKDPSGTVIGTGTNINVCPTATTTYTVEVVNTTCSTPIVVSDQVTVFVNPKPALSVNSPTICSGFNALLTASGASTYTWTGGLPNGPNVSTPVLTSSTSYTVTGTAANGCTNTAVANVTVVPALNITVNSPAICQGQTATLNASGASTYTWTGGLPNGASVTTPPLNANTSYTVTGTDANGCVGTAVSNVSVNPYPTVSVNSPTICSGFTATLNASGASTYTWTGGLPPGASTTTPVLTGNTSYTVTGTDANGCSGTAVSSVTVIPSPSVSVNSPAICEGQTATLNASGALSYTWTGGLPANASVTTPVLTATTSYTVTGLGANGCTNTQVATVTVNPLPAVTVNSPAICSGQSATLTAAGASTYTWTGGLPNGSTVNTPALTANTSYTVTGTDIKGCVNTATSNVTVNPNPVVNVNSPTICAGNSTTLTASGASGYTWSGGLPASASVTTLVLNTTTSYTVTGTDANGCTDTKTATVTVYDRPPVSVNSPAICFGESASLTAAGASTYTWTGGLPNGSSVNTPVLTASTSYTVTGTDALGCQGTATATVTVNLSPTVAVNAPVICAGQTATISASGASTYTWNGGLPPAATVTTLPLNASRSYIVIGADANGCKDTAVSFVTVNPLPNVSVNSPAICSGFSASLNAAGANTYSWTGGLPNGASVTTPVLTASASYTVTGTDANGCVKAAVSNVTVNPLPDVVVNSPLVCEGQTATLSASGANTYTWTGGLPNAPTVTTPVLTASTTYDVTGTDGNGCVQTARATVKVNPVKTTNISQTLCQGETITVGSSTFGTSGNYTVRLTTSAGCDSTVNLDLTVNPVRSTSLRQTICEGQFATVGGQNFGQSGIYTVRLQTAHSCDSTVTLDLTVNPRLPVAVDVTPTADEICLGETVTFTATPTYPGTNPQYQWFINNQPVGNNSPVFSSSSLNNGDQVMAQLVSSEMCVLINPAFSESIPMTVYRLDYTKPQVEFCYGDKFILDLNIPQTEYSITWRNDNFIRTLENTDQLLLENRSSGTAEFSIRYGHACEKRDTVTVTVNPLPGVTVSVDQDTVRHGTEVQLSGVIGDPSATFIWTPATVSNPNTLNPTAVVEAAGWYTLTATDFKGCENKASVFVALVDECNADYVFVPNAFTPNGDGINDCFMPVDISPHTEYKMVVFDRWGERMFETNDATQCWDGHYKGVDALMDTYPFVISYRCYNGLPVEKKGILTLVR